MTPEEEKRLWNFWHGTNLGNIPPEQRDKNLRRLILAIKAEYIKDPVYMKKLIENLREKFKGYYR